MEPVELIADSDYADLVVDDADFAGVDLTGTSFVGCTFRRGSFANAVLRAARFDRCSFTGVDLSNVDLCDAEITRTIVADSKLLGASFAEATLFGVQVRDTLATMLGCFRASVRKVSFVGCDLVDSDWREAQIVESALVRCDLSGAQFGQAGARALDIRGSVLSGSVSLTQARGFVVSSDQVLALAVGVLRQVGARLDDDPPPGLSDLPGAGEVRGTESTDPAAARRGIRAARAQLRKQ